MRDPCILRHQRALNSLPQRPHAAPVPDTGVVCANRSRFLDYLSRIGSEWGPSVLWVAFLYKKGALCLQAGGVTYCLGRTPEEYSGSRPLGGPEALAIQ